MNGVLSEPSTPFNGVFRVLRLVTEHRQDTLRSTHQLIDALSASWCDIRRTEIERNASENHHFNPLCCITIKETDHSKIIGELLDPHGSHGQQSLFLDSFLDLLGIESDGGRWTVAVESGGASGRVDILLRRDNPASVVIIENKVHGAQDRDGQLYRYWFHEIYSRHPHLRYDDAGTSKLFRVVYLPPGGYARPAEWSLRRPADVSYAHCPHERVPMEIVDCRSFQTDVAGWLKKFAGQNLSARLKIFLNFYVEIWSL